MITQVLESSAVWGVLLTLAAFGVILYEEQKRDD